jgi:hypothetical protein
MQMTSTKPRLQVLVLCAIAYLVVGLSFAAAANASAPGHARAGWRLAAYLVSALILAGQFAYERRRAASSAVVVASACGVAVALGAFALAVAANVRIWFGAGAQHHAVMAALAVWPLVTGLPAFAVALGAAVVMKRPQPQG